MTDKPALQGNMARASFGLLLIASLVWAAGGVISTIIQGLPFNWALIFMPLSAVVLLQVIIVWIASAIKSAVAEGMVLYFASAAIQEEIRKKYN